MCEHWGVHVKTYTSRMESPNWTLEEALTTPSDHPVTDPYGITFPSISKLCAAYHISTKQYYRLMHHGKSQLEALGLIPQLNQTLKHYQFDKNLIIQHAINHANIKGKYEAKYFACIVDNHEVILTYPWLVAYCQQHLPPKK